MIEKLREKALLLPMKPGVYIMMDAEGTVIYVGKALKLKNRVSSYFHGSHNAKTELMVSKVSDFDVIVANSEFEALVLENSLIKHHMPKYNILLKDDKGYPFVRLDIESEYPRFSVASKKADDGAAYFGPFGGRNVTFAAIDAVCKALKLPTCSKKFPRDIGKERPCLNHHMGACGAFCLKDTPKSDYTKAIEEAVLIFEGKVDTLTDKLTNEMEQAAERLQFELAAEIRDRLKAVQRLQTKQRVFSQKLPDIDVVGFFRGEAKACFVVLHYIDGSLLDKDYKLIDMPLETDEEAVSAYVRQYYMQKSENVPKQIFLPFATDDMEILQQLISENSGRTVKFSVPQRGEKAKLLQTANLNAAEEVERATTKEEKVRKTAAWLQKALNLPSPPERIESFDISNTGSSDIVASMVVFKNGKPLKKAYRKFIMKTVIGQDDYGSMAEVIERRLSRYKENDEKFSELPDLFLIDGGTNHAMAAKKELDKKGVCVPVFGMVKDDRHRTRALVTPYGDEIKIDIIPAVFSFIGTIQEETHRAAIEFHRNLHSKTVKKSVLDNIDGIGEKRKHDLLKKFGSISAIKNAAVEELNEVVPINTAKKVFEYFHNVEGKSE